MRPIVGDEPEHIELLKAEQVARMLGGVTKAYVYKLGREGLLPRVTMPGEVVRFKPDDVEAFIEQHRCVSQPARPRATRRVSVGTEIPARF